MLNIVIPMAGAGSRFASKGYLQPKPLIPINGMPMIQVVINNLRPECSHRFIFICQEKHVREYQLDRLLPAWAPGCQIIGLDGLTQGAACTVLAARDLINTEDELMIANSDQYVDVDINIYLEKMRQDNLEGLIMTMAADDPKWSFVGLNHEHLVTRVVEKEVISNEATVGIYNFRQGKDFVSSADRMIEKDLRVNNEFYVAPVYNELIENNKRIGIYNIGKEADGMYGLGIPVDLELFLTLPIHRQATRVTK
jgi:NDP-sugar pyrophosphorylase family protein